MAVVLTKSGLQSKPNQSKLGSGGGVYNSSTGTYTDSSGNKYSTATAPAGSVSIGGRSYSGGGGGGGGSSSPAAAPSESPQLTNASTGTATTTQQGFTGKVEVSQNGKLESTQLLYNNRIIATMSGSNATISPEIKSATMTFNNESYQVNQQGVSEYTYSNPVQNNPFSNVGSMNTQQIKDSFYNQVNSPQNQLYNSEINRYKGAGYSQEESMALAKLSMNYGMTPTREVAENYLRNEAPSGRSGVSALVFGKEGIAPEVKDFSSGVSAGSFYLGKAGTRIYELPKNILGENFNIDIVQGQAFGKTIPLYAQPRFLSNLEYNFNKNRFQTNPNLTPTTTNNNTQNIANMSNSKSIQYMGFANFLNPSIVRTNFNYADVGLAVGSVFPATAPFVAPFFVAGAAGDILSGTSKAINIGGFQNIPGYAVNAFKENPISFTGNAIIIGGAAFKVASKIYGTKTSTEILGVSQNLEGNKVITDIQFSAETKRLFSSETRYGVARTITDVKDFNTFQTGKSVTFGVTARQAFEFPTGRNVIFDVKSFGAGSIDFSKSADISVYNFKFSNTGLLEDVSEPVARKMSAGFGVGKVATKDTSEFFMGVGGTYGNEKAVRIFGETAIVKNGKASNLGSYSGVVIRKFDMPLSDITSFQGGGAKSSSEFIAKLYNPEIQKSMQSVSANIPNAIKTSFGMPKITAGMLAPIQQEKQYPTYAGGNSINAGIQEYEMLSTNQFYSQKTSLAIFNVQKNNLGASNKFNQSFNQSQEIKQMQNFTQVFNQSQSQRINQKMFMNQNNINSFQNFNQNFPATNTPTMRFWFPWGSMKGKQFSSNFNENQRLKYTPDFASLALGIYGRQPRAGGFGYTGARPITRNFTWAFSKNKFRMPRL